MYNKNEQFVLEIICIYMFSNNRNTMNTRLLYLYMYNCIQLVSNWQLIKKHTKNFNFCMTFVLCIYAIYYKYYSTAQGLHSPNLYRF